MSDKAKERSLAFRALKHCMGEIWQNKKSYFVFSALNVIFSALQPFANILLMPMLIDTLVNDRDFKKAAVIGTVMVISGVLISCLASCTTIHLEKYADYFLNMETEQASRLCMEIDFTLTEDKDALDQIQKAREGIAWSGGAHEIAKGFFTILSNVIKLLGVITVIIFAAPVLLAVIAVLLAVSALINNKKNKIDIKFFKELAKRNRIYDYIEWQLDQFRFAKDIRLYDAADMMMTNAGNNYERLRQDQEKTSYEKYSLDIADAGTNSLRDFATYLYLGILAITGKITVGTFSQLISAAGTLSSSIQAIILGVQDIVKRSGYMCEFIKFMEYPPALEKGDRKISDIKGGHEIEFRNVTFSYPHTNVQVLKNVSIKLKSGEKLSVVGLNGAGKTTFIKLLCRLYDVDSGEILLDGVNIREYDYEEYMKLFSVVFQDFMLLAFSAQDNILLGEKGNAEEVDELFRKTGILDKINSLPKGKDTMMFKMFDKEGVELSGGEQQKMAIARALYKNAPVVILDEPTAALDPVAEYDIYRQFNDLVHGKTAVYISHRLSSCKFCDHIAVFSGGTIKEYGTHDELVRRHDGIYAEMFKAQAQYYI